eukprot:GHVS01073686.1.p1 GENE.GHVS01073686.1~~GHVS01073686.1.p1  ORF type:complete len:101 (-),score=7.72 GHVS01073686.1:106-408(-)
MARRQARRDLGISGDFTKFPTRTVTDIYKDELADAIVKTGREWFQQDPNEWENYRELFEKEPAAKQILHDLMTTCCAEGMPIFPFTGKRNTTRARFLSNL